MKIKGIVTAAAIATTTMVAPAEAQRITDPVELAQIRGETRAKLFDAIQVLAAKRRAAAQLSYRLPRFSPAWEAARAEYRELSRQIFILQRNWILTKFINRRGALEYYFNYAKQVISAA